VISCRWFNDAVLPISAGRCGYSDTSALVYRDLIHHYARDGGNDAGSEESHGELKKEAPR
jgi:hypothetical protein